MCICVVVRYLILSSISPSLSLSPSSFSISPFYDQSPCHFLTLSFGKTYDENTCSCFCLHSFAFVLLFDSLNNKKDAETHNIFRDDDFIEHVSFEFYKNYLCNLHYIYDTVFILLQKKFFKLFCKNLLCCQDYTHNYI